MIYKIIRPSKKLAEYIEHYWLMKSGQETSDAADRVIPTGNCELMFHFGNPFKITDANNISKIQPRFFLCGQKNTFCDASTMGNTGLLAVTFKPHAVKMFFNLPIIALQNVNLALGDFLGREGREVSCKIAEAKTDRERVIIVEEFLYRRIALNRYFDFKRIEATINHIYKQKKNPSIDELSGIACLSVRQYERKFLDFIGLPPKQYLRISRFQKIIKLKRSLFSELNMTQLAFEAGYYDQSHFIREFRTLSGYSPKEFFELECENQNVIPEK
jgi:AraC-like DNA-binding protein